MKFLKIADNIHDFNISSPKPEIELSNKSDILKIGKNDKFEQKLYLTFYTLIRFFGKVKVEQYEK
jgi:hypothetical protein